MTKYKLTGGLSLPDLRDYFVATLLDQVKFWFSNLEQKHWSDIEQSFVPLGCLHSLVVSYW